MINVGNWVRKWSILKPHKVVYFYDGQPTKYKELNDHTNQLCQLLIDIGIKKGDRVAVLLYNSPPYLEIFFAVSKIGAILVPINWRLAGPEMEFILNDSKAKVLIFDQEFVQVVSFIRPRLNYIPAYYLCVGSPYPDWSIEYYESKEKYSTKEPLETYNVGDDDPHIIMYTSGTTGVPKGAILSHRKTFFNVLNADFIYNLTSSDIMIVPRPMFHSGGLLVESAPILYKGGTLILKKRFRPEEILEAVERYRVTILELPATVYQFILQQCDLSRYDLRSIRCYFTGGERISISLLQEYAKKGINISQIYGQTEASTIAYLPFEKAIEKMGSVGLPVFHGEIRIVDKNGNEVGPEEVGEIIVKGPTLMNGYWNRPDLTSETIRDGWLFTGDLAKKDKDGYIYIVDRERDMYISGGENVYPAEIEKIILSHPKVAEVGIIGVPDGKWGEVGKAYIVLKPGVSMDKEEAIQYLHEKIARYKIPKYFEFVEELPKTSSGKIQKVVLKEWHDTGFTPKLRDRQIT